MRETLNDREKYLLTMEEERKGKNKIDLKKFEHMFKKGAWQIQNSMGIDEAMMKKIGDAGGFDGAQEVLK